MIDDGSTDGTAEIVQRYAASDPRERFFAREAKGIVAALNFGLEQCRAPLVARMDGDDVMHSQRLARQLGVFTKAFGTSLCATDINLFTSQATGAGMYEYIDRQHGLLDSESIDADVFWEAPFYTAISDVRSR